MCVGKLNYNKTMAPLLWRIKRTASDISDINPRLARRPAANCVMPVARAKTGLREVIRVRSDRQILLETSNDGDFHYHGPSFAIIPSRGPASQNARDIIPISPTATDADGRAADRETERDRETGWARYCYTPYAPVPGRVGRAKAIKWTDIGR